MWNPMRLPLTCLFLLVSLGYFASRRGRAIRWRSVAWLALVVGVGGYVLSNGLLRSPQAAHASAPLTDEGGRDPAIAPRGGARPAPGDRTNEPDTFPRARLVEAAARGASAPHGGGPSRLEAEHADRDARASSELPPSRGGLSIGHDRLAVTPMRADYLRVKLSALSFSHTVAMIVRALHERVDPRPG
jgi:hypothetical protein